MSDNWQDAYDDMVNTAMDLRAELSEERERNGRLRALVDQLTQERDAARMDARRVAGKRSFMP